MRVLPTLLLTLAVVPLAVAAPTEPPASATRRAEPPSATAPPAASAIELVESVPIETTLDHADLRDAAEVWPAMLAGAKRNLDIAEFYATSAPQSRLEPVIAALQAAAARGVRVRFLVDDGFAAHEHEVIDRLSAGGRISVRRLDMKARAGGILHAKYFIVDGSDAYVGSQNFDWRSLTHIQELGVRLHAPAIAGTLEDLFETDWALAGAGAAAARTRTHVGARWPLVVGSGAARMELTPVASPRGWLADETLWELPRIVALIDGARRSVRVQLLTYQALSHGQPFDELDAALRRAAGRGVEVQLLISDWCKRKGCIDGLKRLQALPHVRVALLTIPLWSGGFIPYARVAHAKYLVVDGERAWIGTSNWERDYFYASRNVGLIIAGGAIPARLDAFFSDGWKSPYAALVDVAAAYEAPRTH